VDSHIEILMGRKFHRLICIFKEGYGDKWAEMIPTDRFSNTANLWQLLEDFMRYCNIKEPPRIERGLFV